MKVARGAIALVGFVSWAGACQVEGPVRGESGTDSLLVPTESAQKDECVLDCDDGDACTADSAVLDGTDCVCVNDAITDAVDSDGCCPEAATSLDDNDCAPVCGNGVLEEGESCDTAIEGTDGACPDAAACDDGDACTVDEVALPGTCNALCGNTTITEAAEGDACCPIGADSQTDGDCTFTCGDGVWEDGETCDTAIPAGDEGTCVASCDDGDACTADELRHAGTCQAGCDNAPIVDTADGDGCCPSGGNANTDSDCSPSCGNGVVEEGEQCDGGDACGSNCIYPGTAYRVTELLLRDPHAFAGALFFCIDATDNTNEQIANRVQNDTDGDGLLDLSIAMVFRPLAQSEPQSVLEFHIAECEDAADVTCQAGPKTVSGPADNLEEGVCLGPNAGTVDYSPSPAEPEGPCFVSQKQSLTVELAGLPITLQDAQIAATYVGEPADELTSGLIMGFLSEDDAENVIIPDDVPFVGGKPLAALFPGGQDNCSNDDARDVGPDGVTSGWWIYLDFEASPVGWVDSANTL